MNSIQHRHPTDLTDDFFGNNCNLLVASTPKKISKRQKRPPKNDKKLKKEFEKVALKNESLTSLIKKKNIEIASLKRSSDSLHHILDMVPGDGLHLAPTVANQKLVEVNNQNRKLTVELMTAKSQLNKKELQLRAKDMSLRSLENRMKLDSSKPICRIGKVQTKNLDKTVQALRSDNAMLAKNLKQALECLQSETGHKWNLEEFLNNPSDWKGRERKIKYLESQISQYSDQIESYKRLLNMDAPYDSHISAKSSQYIANTAEEIIHCARIKTLENENASLRRELERQKSNALNMRVRNEALNEEVLNCRAVIFSIRKNTGNSQNQLDSLRDVITNQKMDYEERLGVMNHEMRKLKNALEEAKVQESKAKTKLDDAEKLGLENSERIEKLLKEKNDLENHLKSFCGGFLFSCRDLHKDEFLNIVDGLEAEKNKLSTKLSQLEQKFKTESDRNEYLKGKLSDQEALIEDLQHQLEKLKTPECDRPSKKRSIAKLDRLNKESPHKAC